MMVPRVLLALSCAALATLPACPQQAAPSQPVDPAHLSAVPAPAQQQGDRYKRLAEDYGQLTRYAAADAALPAAEAGDKRVVFYGDSITDAWHLDQSFPGKANYINRGISGQTTPQMLVRFRQDVLALRPAVVVLLAGTNDLAGNTGPETIQQIEDNYATMAELARVHGIAFVFSSVMPVNNYVHPEMTTGRPPAQILVLNDWMKQYAAANSLVYLDYFAAMVDAAGMLKKDISADGLHPNGAGYAVMAPLAQAAVDRALALPVAKP